MLVSFPGIVVVNEKSSLTLFAQGFPHVYFISIMRSILYLYKNTYATLDYELFILERIYATIYSVRDEK